MNNYTPSQIPEFNPAFSGANAFQYGGASGLAGYGTPTTSIPIYTQNDVAPSIISSDAPTEDNALWVRSNPASGPSWQRLTTRTIGICTDGSVEYINVLVV